ncbi:MAG: YciI family protein [Acidobacteriota bacterium]
MKQYFLFLYESPGAFDAVSPEEMQNIVARYIAWRNEVAAKGNMLGGNKLRDGEGRVMRATAGKVSITDGPFAENKEVIGGYFHIQAESYDQAAEIASTCPHVEYGVIEIREMEITH